MFMTAVVVAVLLYLFEWQLLLSVHLFGVYVSVLLWYVLVQLLLTCFDNLQDELGTEYLVRPVGRAEDEEDASDFEPEENGVDEDEGDDAGGKGEAPPKRKRSDKDDSDDDDDGDGGEGDERPSKR